MPLRNCIPFLDSAGVFTLTRTDWPRWKPENIVRRRRLATSCIVFITFPQPGDNGILNVWGELVGEEDMLTENRVSIVVKEINQGREFDGRPFACECPSVERRRSREEETHLRNALSGINSGTRMQRYLKPT